MHAPNRALKARLRYDDQPPFALHPYTGTLVKQELSRTLLESEW